MMKCPSIALLAVLAVLSATIAACAEGPSLPALEADPATNAAFTVGEHLVYQIYWGVVPVGRSWIKTEWVEQRGRPLIRIRYRTKTNALFNKLYPIDDRADTLVDPGTFLPLRFKRTLVKRRIYCDDTTLFEHHKGTAIWISDCKDKSKVYTIEKNTRDLLSFMYHTRRQTFDPNTEHTLKLQADDGLFDVNLKVLDYSEVGTSIFGKVNSLEMQPEFDFKGLLADKGKVRMWISDDPRHLCTRLEVKAPLATVKIILIRVFGPGDDTWTKTMEEEEFGEDEEKEENEEADWDREKEKEEKEKEDKKENDSKKDSTETTDEESQAEE